MGAQRDCTHYTRSKRGVLIKAVIVPELSLSHNRTGGPGDEQEAPGRLYLCCSSSITTGADVLTIKQAAERVLTGKSSLTCVEHLLDDHSHLPLQHGVEQLDDEDEAGAEAEQRQSQENEAHGQV